ncbi:MAG: DUF72 domain-containing protein [Devosia nanyangense]|uniref:DUF72 domain-containing protein n=1 Tax=Devosia nanyangense TaxID=1228055 RepID=A0A933L4D8_9HYPH|nr:DUF72 domain-containing protein [Devosia nanyangense]
MTGRVRTGMAGWVFEDWRGGQFYPDGLKQKDELSYASRHVGAIEINATFYSNQKAASFLNWKGQTPPDFMFAVKGHQLVTHIKKLKDVEGPLANFFASGVLALGERLGPICWQLPGNLGFNPERIASFLDLLPHAAKDAVALAEKHDERITAPHLDAAGVGPVRHAIEVRHKSFADPAFIAMLRAANVALVVADTADWPYFDQTADFTYCRLQGAPGGDHYEPQELDAWAKRFGSLAAGKGIGDGAFVVPPEGAEPERDVFAFFVSTDKPNAPRNALGIIDRLGLEPAAD